MLKRKTAYDKIWELSDQTTSPTKGFTIEYSKEMEKKLKHNEELSKQYTLKVKELNEDFQLIETYRIITDFLEEKVIFRPDVFISTKTILYLHKINNDVWEERSNLEKLEK